MGDEIEEDVDPSVGMFLGHVEQPYGMEKMVQDTLAGYEPSVITNVYEQDADDGSEVVLQCVSHQNGTRYGFEVNLDQEPDMVFDAIDRMVCSMEERVVEDAGLPVHPSEERDEPAFIDSDCECGAVLDCVHADKGFYEEWECPDCGAGYTDSFEKWDGWL